ncbi:MAG: restriction endonuclease [Sulfurimonas sp.]|nr:restriction endonuclease [Sulfurimonas sp.]
MKYPLNELSSGEFENVVASICEEILGTGIIVFSEGKDGGRDAKFTGRANSFPSEASPWDGKIIIQAKHTVKIGASCSDSDFSTTLKKEVLSIKDLKDDEKLDYYFIFTNRKLSGLQDPKIEDFITDELDVENVVIGEERIQKWLHDYPSIVKKNNLSRLLLPLEFYEEDLKILITRFSEIDFDGEELQEITRNNDRIPISEKNDLNKLSQDYFNSIFKKSMNDFSKIETFIKNPKNREIQNFYDNTIDDIQSKILVKRSEFSTFEEIIEYLYDFVFQNHSDELKNDRRLIRTFLHYMYFHCDIGVME